MRASTEIDWEWAVRTDGLLSDAQRRKLSLDMERVVTGLVAGRPRTAGAQRGTGRLDFADLRLPDSSLARAAETEAREQLSSHVLGHSYRTYFFGRVLADLAGVRYDDELCYVSCLLHDLQLEHPTPGRCFAVAGAHRAIEFVTSAGATPEVAQAIGAAIAAHITPGTDADLGNAGGFIAAGASADVAGARLSKFDPAWVAELLERHPRHEFKRHMIAALTAEAAAVPHGRTSWLIGRGALPKIEASPFAE
ncbi:phosphohydrolase [Nocardia altamirensis]|uniref:phosphohydrolase n=1 Tax=Nocardia altamirensis TaxID=472158 RepID=UPI003F772DCE